MRQVGSYEAKTHLPKLLKAVEKGETIVITHRGTPIARLVPIGEGDRRAVRDTIARIRKDRVARPHVGREEILAARDEGRKG